MKGFGITEFLISQLNESRNLNYEHFMLLQDFWTISSGDEDGKQIYKTLSEASLQCQEHSQNLEEMVIPLLDIMRKKEQFIEC